LQEAESLNEMLKPVSKKLGEALYVTSRDGGKATDFHSACDNKGPTVVIVETTAGVVFGGYTSVSWGVDGLYHKCTTCFLFQLRPNVRKYAVRKGALHVGVFHYSKSGPVFGHGHDLDISDNSLSNTNSYVSGSAYASSGYSLNEGKRNFQVKQYIVLKAMDI